MKRNSTATIFTFPKTFTEHFIYDSREAAESAWLPAPAAATALASSAHIDDFFLFQVAEECAEFNDEHRQHLDECEECRHLLRIFVASHDFIHKKRPAQ